VFDTCPRLPLGGRLLFGGAVGATVCTGTFEDCPRLALGGRLLFLGCEFFPDVTTVGGVAGATVCRWEDICPRFALCPSGSLFDAVLGEPLSDGCLFIGGFDGACMESATVGLPTGACRT